MIQTRKHFSKRCVRKNKWFNTLKDFRVLFVSILSWVWLNKMQYSQRCNDCICPCWDCDHTHTSWRFIYYRFELNHFVLEYITFLRFMPNEEFALSKLSSTHIQTESQAYTGLCIQFKRWIKTSRENNKFIERKNKKRSTLPYNSNWQYNSILKCCWYFTV